MNEKFKILDIIALLTDIPEKKLIKGQVGTIVEYLYNNIYEVEFCNKQGETISVLPIDENSMLLLHYENKVA